MDPRSPTNTKQRNIKKLYQGMPSSNYLKEMIKNIVKGAGKKRYVTP